MRALITTSPGGASSDQVEALSEYDDFPPKQRMGVAKDMMRIPTVALPSLMRIDHISRPSDMRKLAMAMSLSAP